MVAAMGWAAETTCPHCAVGQRLVNCFCKGPVSIYVGLCGTEGSVAIVRLYHLLPKEL